MTRDAGQHVEELAKDTIPALREEIRTNRALLIQAQADRDYAGAREEVVWAKIRDLEAKIRQIREAATTAPERIKRISATITDQEVRLAKLEAARERKTSLDDRIRILVDRLASGDADALLELTRLVSK